MKDGRKGGSWEECRDVSRETREQGKGRKGKRVRLGLKEERERGRKRLGFWEVGCGLRLCGVNQTRTFRVMRVNHIKPFNTVKRSTSRFFWGRCIYTHSYTNMY